MKRPNLFFPILAAFSASFCLPATAATTVQDGSEVHSPEQLAKKLSNPIASLISVPIQNNFDFGGGPDGDGTQWKMNVQPVIPFRISEDWNLITRTIIPVVYQDDVAGTKAEPSGSQFGLQDTLFSAWFSPVEPTSNGWIWGVGPVAYIPTGTDSDEFLGSNQWGLGPTAIALKLDGKFTYGCLVNHVSGISGSQNGAPAINSTFIQPFLVYLPGGGWSYLLNTESTYNWQSKDDEWAIPINASIRKMSKIGNQPVQWEFGGRYYLDTPDNGPEWGLRATLTLLFP